MARNRFRGTRFVRKVGRTSWFGLTPTSTSLGTSAAALVSSLNAAALARCPFTILRTHLMISIASDQLAADESQFGAVAMAVVTEQASAIGVTAVPTPINDLASDLFYLHELVASALQLNSAIGMNSPARYTVKVDSKAMRKVNDDQDIILVAETSAISSGVNYQIAGRFLIKES